MARQIVTKKDLQNIKTAGTKAPGTVDPGPQLTQDSYLDRVLKFVPAEIVTVYVFVQGLLGQPPEPVVCWIVFIACLVITPLYSWKVTHVTKVTQLVISTVAFAFWAFSLGGPFATMAWYKPLYGAILLPIYTLVIAIVEPEN